MASGPNFAALREQSRRELTAVIDMIRGPKALVLDPSLSGPLGLVAEKQLLKDHGVEKTYHLRSEPLDTDQRRMVFLVRDSILNMKAIAAQVKHDQQRREKLQYVVCLVPRRTIICERVLEEEGVYSDVMLADYHLGLIAVEEDVLSMEMPDALRQSTLGADASSLVDTARSLLRLEHLVGRIPQIKGKGALAKSVADMLLRMRLEPPPPVGEGADDAAAASGEGGELEPMIDELILIDRSTDLITPLLSQLTYQGLIDDMYGINNGIVELPSHLLLPTGATAGADKKKKVKVYLNSSDTLFSQLRDANFEQVGALVKKRATFLKSVQDEKDELQHKSVGEIKEYVRKLKLINIQQEKNLLSLHTSIALEIKQTVSESDFSRRLELEQALLQGSVSVEKAVEYIEALVYKGYPLLKVLRLLCLTSLVTDGIKKLDNLKTELVHVYGFEIVLMLERLESGGLLKRADAPSSIASVAGMSLTSAGVSVAKLTNKLTASSGWEAIKRRMRLLVEADDAGSLELLAQTYSGYVPLSVRVAQEALFPPPAGWLSLQDTMSEIPGPIFHDTSAANPPRPRITPPPSDGAVAGKTRHVALVFFVGGVTAAEVSLVRALAAETMHNPDGIARSCIVGASKVVSGDEVVGSFYDPFPNALRKDKPPVCKPHSSSLR